MNATPDRLTVATHCQIWELENVLAPGETYQDSDHVYVPRRAHTTGKLHVQDVRRGAENDILFVNTTYSCLATPSDAHSFRSVWTPPFISELAPEDRCHLSGLAIGADGEARYSTAGSQSDVRAGWRERRDCGGTVIDVQTDEVVAEGLSMPHAPRLYNGQLYLVNGGTGELGRLSPATGHFEPIARCPGFTRGLAVYDGYAIVGVGKPRASEAVRGLEVDKRLSGKKAACGVYVIDLETGDCEHWMRFRSPIEEVCSVEVLPGVRRPLALGMDADEIQRFITVETAEGSLRHFLSSEAAGPEEGSLQHDPDERKTIPETLLSMEGPGSMICNTRVSADQAYRFHVGSATAAELLERFKPLLPSRFRRRVQAGAIDLSEQLAGVWASVDDRPIGLAVASGTGDRSVTNVVGIGVLPPHRGQGIGTALLKRLEAVARDAGSPVIQARYRSTLSSVAALERVFEKREWDSPRVARSLYRCRREEVPVPFIDHLPNAPPSEGQIVDWKALTEGDRRRLREQLQSPDEASIPQALNPFQMEDRIEPRCSIALRVEGRVGGWMVVHRLAEDVLQYTSLYVEPDLRGSDGGPVLLAEAMRRGLDRTDVSRFIWMVNADNEKMRRFSDAFLEPLIVSHAELLLVGKRLNEIAPV